MPQKKNPKITTIKLNKDTKQRLERVRLHNRESYDELVQRIMNILNICRADPEKAQRRLRFIERQIRRRIRTAQNKNINN